MGCSVGCCCRFGFCSSFANRPTLGAEGLEQVFHYGSYVNGALCLLNLCPVPPLDGFGVIRSLVTENIQIQEALNRFSGIGLLVLWMTPAGSYLFFYGGKLADFFTVMWLAPIQILS